MYENIRRAPKYLGSRQMRPGKIRPCANRADKYFVFYYISAFADMEGTIYLSLKFYSISSFITHLPLPPTSL